MADLPQGSGYCIAKVRMRNTNSSRAWSTVQCSAMTCQPSAHRAVCTRVLCLTVDTRVPRFCVGPRLGAILLNTYGKEKFFSPSAITTVSWPAFTTPDPSIALDSAPVYNDSAVLTRAIRKRVASNPLSLPGKIRGRDLNLNFARWVGQLNSN